MPVLHPLYDNDSLTEPAVKLPITFLITGAILALVVVMVITSSGEGAVTRSEEVEG